MQYHRVIILGVICLQVTATALAQVDCPESTCEEIQDLHGYINDDHSEYVWLFNTVNNNSEHTLILRVINVYLAVNPDSYWWCSANFTIQGIPLCSMEPGTCLIVQKEMYSFKRLVKQLENCTTKIWVTDGSGDMKISFKKRGSYYENYHQFNIIYDMIANAEQEYTETTHPIATASQLVTDPSFDDVRPWTTNNPTTKNGESEKCTTSKVVADKVPLIMLSVLCAILLICMLVLIIKQRRLQNQITKATEVGLHHNKTDHQQDLQMLQGQPDAVYSVVKKNKPEANNERVMVENELYEPAVMR